MKKSAMSIFASLLLITSCNFTICKGENYCIINPGTHNLWGLNSERNDYNSAGPNAFTKKTLDIIYATEYNKFGIDNGYDIYNGHIEFILKRESGENYLKTERGSEITYLNTSAEERGPVKIYSEYLNKEVYLVSTNRTDTKDVTGDYNILGTYIDKNNKVKTFNFGGNTNTGNELYISIDEANEVIYYCSDKDGKFNIYSYEYNSDTDDNIINILSSPEILTKAKPITAINDPAANDECPYIYKDYLFFISDRKGGFGGTDIYYSKKDSSGNFGEPKNLGSNVNTEHNEYRVSCYSFYDHQKSSDDDLPELIIFSSDRPGGLGGYDLYLSILKNIEVHNEENYY